MSPGQIECLLSHYPNIIGALTAVGTVGAVITSVAIAWASARTNRTRLKAWLDVRRVMGDGILGEDPPRYLVVTLTNKGNSTARIEFSFFVWKIPFQKEYYSVNPLDHYGVDHYYPQQAYPVAIQSRASHTACLSDLATFQTEMVRTAEGLRLSRALRMRFARAYVWTSDGARFRVKISPSVRKHLVEAGR